MGRVLVKVDDPSMILSYDPNLAKDPRFRVVEDKRFETARLSGHQAALNVAERVNPQLDGRTDKAAAVAVEAFDEAEFLADYMEKSLIILECLGIPDVPTSLHQSMDMAINRLMNPVDVADLAEVPKAQLEDIPDAPPPADPEEEVEAAVDGPAPEEEELDQADASAPEEPLGYETSTDADFLEVWARENLGIELDKRFTIRTLKKHIKKAIDARQ